VSLLPPTRELTVCYVTDRKALSSVPREQTRLLLEKMESVAREGADWIQVREKDLPGRELAALVAEALRRISHSCRILVNDRLDVAIAIGAGGVHLGESSVSVSEGKRMVREKIPGADFLLGVSVHSLELAQAAQKSGADYAIFGPVFETPSKAAFGRPQGLQQLAEVCQSASIPVLAIGGIAAQNARECVTAGASGIAAIRLFQDTEDLEQLLRGLRAR
jgi:thiamine-phosphate pyrophosphorylase